MSQVEKSNTQPVTLPSGTLLGGYRIKLLTSKHYFILHQKPKSFPPVLTASDVISSQDFLALKWPIVGPTGLLYSSTFLLAISALLARGVKRWKRALISFLA